MTTGFDTIRNQLTGQDLPTDTSPLTACHVWRETWQTISELQEPNDLRLCDDLRDFVGQTKDLVAACERQPLDPSPLVLFFDRLERFYHGAGTKLPGLTNKLQTLLRRLELKLERELPTVTAIAQVAAVVLAGTTKQPIVRGKPKPVLRFTQYNVAKALVDAGEIGLTLDQMVNKSGHSDARGILNRLADSDPDWKAVIHFPGKAGGHYRIG